MNCNQAIEYIHSLEKFSIKPGMERIRAICDALGNPQDKLKIIHIAGTNGKGSTSTVISNILIESGYSTGLFISPYVTDFRERIQFNGKMIAEEELAECVGKVKAVIEELSSNGIQPTEFEAITAAAFLYFEKKSCDYVVLEVGLGGRLDSTNIIKSSCVSVITSVSFDHTAVLGNTIEEIAAEKSGIIKNGNKTVVYPFQNEKAMNVISEKCNEMNSTLIIPDVDFLSIGEESLEGTSAEYKGIKFLLPLSGEHMVYNTCTAIEAVKALDCGVSDDNISSGIGKSVMPARTELICKNPVILLDGGHNEGCANALSLFIEKHLKGKRIVMVSSMMADKDYMSYLRIVAPFAETFIATKADVPRALDADSLCKSASEFCKNCLSLENPVDAILEAEKMLGEDDVLIVCGSFYLAGEIRNNLLNF